ncbi:MAG: RAD55 family ATPase [Chloroflexaceae bacterium]
MTNSTPYLETTSAAVSDVLPTGVPGLDMVLGGGLPVGSMLLVVGGPGSGKTILSQQLCFNLTATHARRAIYFSTLTEPHSKIVRQIRPFHFFDDRRLGDTVLLLALENFMQQGLEATAETIVRTARQQRADLVCIDGFRAIEGMCTQPIDVRRFLYQLSSQLHLLGTTTLIALERGLSEFDDYGAYTIADGVLACHFDVHGVRHQRKIEVRKLRTMAPLTGLHSYRISAAGWTIFPRIEALVAARYSDSERRNACTYLSSGLTRLDELLGGGYTTGSTTLIAGEPGMGKTLLSFYYLHEAIKQGEAALFIGFHEHPDQLLAKAEYFGIPLAAAVQSGQIQLRIFAPTELEPDAISAVIHQAVEEQGIQRLVVDELFELERATAREERMHDYLGALVTFLYNAGVTTYITRMIDRITAETVDVSTMPLAVVAGNVLLLRNVMQAGTTQRMVSIVNTRSNFVQHSVNTYTIGPEGLTIMGTATS